MLKVNIPILKHHLFAAFRALPSAAIVALLSLALAACSKDDPEPEPPNPPTPVEPGTAQRVALRLQARPAGDNPEPWSPTDTLHLVLAEPAAHTALGDTALFRYVFPEKADATDKATCFIPVSVADSAFLPSDSSLVDLMVYRPASPAFQLDRLLLSVDTREQTATGRPLMAAERTVGLHAGQPEANIVLSHRLTRLYVNMNMIDSTGTATATETKAKAVAPSITLHGNPAQAVWSLPDERFIEYGDTLPQPFAMQNDGLGGYLYTLPGIEGNTPSLTLTIEIPDRAPLNISLNEYLPEGLLQTGVSIEIQIDVPKNPDPGIDPEPDPTPDPDPNPNPSPDPDPSPGPDPTPPDPNILRIQVTQSDWEDIIYDITLEPDGEGW